MIQLFKTTDHWASRTRALLSGHLLGSSLMPGHDPYFCGKIAKSAILKAAQSCYHLLKEAEDPIVCGSEMPFCLGKTSKHLWFCEREAQDLLRERWLTTWSFTAYLWKKRGLL